VLVKLSLPPSTFCVADAAVPLLAGCTFENGIVGYAVGNDDGKPAFRAMCDGNFVGHNPHALCGFFRIPSVLVASIWVQVAGQSRIESDTPSFAAITVVAPGVRFKALAIFFVPALAFAMVFICRTSSFVHARRTIILVFAFAICFWNSLLAMETACTTASKVGNHEILYKTRILGFCLLLRSIAKPPP
jgi:hypothetical protein